MPQRAPALPPAERRAEILNKTIPLILERGATVTTREIATAAGIAEGTIFRVFPDKEALLEAAVELVCNPDPTERALQSIDPSLPFEDQLVEATAILQRRFVEVWRLLTAIGAGAPKGGPPEYVALVSLFEGHEGELRYEPKMAARQLRSLTLALSHPVLFGDDALPPTEIVELLLDGIRRR